MEKYLIIGLIGILIIANLGCIDSKHPDEIARELEQEILQISPPDMDIQDAIETLFQISDYCYLTVCDEDIKVCFSRDKSSFGHYDHFHTSVAYNHDPPRIRGRYNYYRRNKNIFTFFREISTNPNPIKIYASYAQQGDKWIESQGYTLHIEYDFILPQETSRDILNLYYLARGYGMSVYPKEDIIYFLRIKDYPAPPRTSISKIEYNGQLMLWATSYKFVPKTFTFLTIEMCGEEDFDPYLLTFSIVAEEYPVDFHIDVISHDDIEEYIYTINQTDEIISIKKVG